MPKPTVEKLMRVLYRDGVVYDIDTDNVIRAYANRMTALAFFDVLSGMDDAAPDFGDTLREGLEEVTFLSINRLVRSEDGSWVRWDELPKEDVQDADMTHWLAACQEGKGTKSDLKETDDSLPSSVHYLRLVWVSNEAAYFAIHMLAYLDAPYVQSASRKREDNVHHLRLELESPERLDHFITSLRDCPFFVKVEESTEDIFNKAPSHAM